ncbi:BTB/POZ domain-containing protein KCTD7-like [Glandiceps talaboti]
MFSDGFGRRLETDKNNCYFIDRDGTFFGHILNFVRNEKMPPPEATLKVYDEAKFYGLEILVKVLEPLAPVQERNLLEKARMEIPNYRQRLGDIMTTASKCGLGETPVKSHSEVYIGVRYDCDMTPGLKPHDCQWLERGLDRKKSKVRVNVIPYTFTGPKDNILIYVNIAQKNLPVLLQRDLEFDKFKVTINDITQEREILHCVRCFEQYQKMLKPESDSSPGHHTSLDLRHFGIGFLMHRISFTWF